VVDPVGEADRGALRLDFGPRVLLQFRDAAITSDAGLLTYHALNNVLRLTDTEGCLRGIARVVRKDVFQFL
jgi:hypothetical protein